MNATLPLQLLLAAAATGAENQTYRFVIISSGSRFSHVSLLALCFFFTFWSVLRVLHLMILSFLGMFFVVFFFCSSVQSDRYVPLPPCADALYTECDFRTSQHRTHLPPGSPTAAQHAESMFSYLSPGLVSVFPAELETNKQILSLNGLRLPTV